MPDEDSSFKDPWIYLGVYPNMDAVDELIKVRRRVEPQEVNQEVYERMYLTYRQFYSALAPIYGSSLKDA